MSKRVEKLCKQFTGPRTRRYLKRAAVRARRRTEKPDPENGACRLRELTRGWSD